MGTINENENREKRAVLRTGIVSFTFVFLNFISRATVGVVFQPCSTCYANCSLCTLCVVCVLGK